ncbi:MAG: methyltransferase domain-containing protein [Magnetococcales bacterium]|nr:methyltransferase domain-containing protein [Magnetococcales bacterium]MBF0321897.1 methyltransferase domain-containing protein [Magnetococcales bacterium]
MRCRACTGSLHTHPLLRLEDMPDAAQFLPDAAALASERGADLDLLQCAACGLIQLGGAPVHYYREVVRAAAYSPEMGAFREEQLRGFARQFGLVGHKVLEIGCGKGEYLTLLQKVGMQAHGLEFSSASVDHCREQGLTVHAGYVENEETLVPDAPFAAFFIFNFLEHMPDPRTSLRGMAHNLVPHGVGLVEVPNLDMILRHKLFSEFIRDHLTYFTRATLTNLLAMCSFEVIDCQEVWHDYILSATVRKRSPTDVSSLIQHREHIHRDIHQYLDGFMPRRVAVWGAGHQALAILSLVRIQDRIRYVVDSAPFKQGRFTPATHLPIVAPQHLLADPVDGIIVMAAAYSDEVAKRIQQQYDQVKGVAILRDYGLEIVKNHA